MARVELAGKPILITGASSGIGRATAIACANAGMAVFATARRADKLETLVDEIERAGGRAASRALDVDNPEACAQCVQACVERMGGVYAVFANAGFGREGAAHEVTTEQVRALFETNLFGSLHIIRPALGHMLDARSGHVLWCSSCLALLPTPYYSAYSASKAAQHHFGRAMRVELRGTGVHSTTVHPIGTKTEFFETTNRISGGAKLFRVDRDRFMQPAERVARGVVGALRRPKPEVWTSFPARVAFNMVGRFPRTADALLVRAKHRRFGEAQEP